MRRRAAAVLAALLAWTGAALAAPPKAELWEVWNEHDETSGTVVNHAPWEAFLAQFLVESPDGINRVKYGAVDYESRARLGLYIQDLGRLKVTKLRRDEQRVLWINLYNAFTVKLIADRYPVSSIRSLDISPGVFVKGPWGAKLIKIQDDTLSLDDIEHRILRPIWNDPRTHYALNCASLGCPNLARHAYSTSNLEAQLEAGARAFVNHPRGARVEDGKLHVSSLYEWYKTDFGGSDRAVIEHLTRYAAPGLAMDLSVVDKIADDAYDWRLNDAEPVKELE